MRKYLLVLASLFMWAAAAHVELADDFERVPDSAEWQGASWENLITIERGLTLDQAFEFAANNPEIGYFFYTTGYGLALDTPAGFQFFEHGDVAFFSGTPWWGTAPGLADGYVKRQ